ncbi:MAG: hypothetical protein CMP14_00810 [Rickettsiales bacterium]|nr:hypothetical protein [Rickettsiales bacterium]
MTTTQTKKRTVKIDFAKDYAQEIKNANSVKVIDFRHGAPIVHIPKGTKLSGKFTASIDYTIHCTKLLSDGDQNTKLAKSNNSDTDYRSFGLSLAPHKISGYNTCKNATTCADTCLDSTGLRSVFESIHIGKIARTIAFFKHRRWFLNRLETELENKCKHGVKTGYIPCFRLNMFSDLPWENFIDMEYFYRYQCSRAYFYDYTKCLHRAGLQERNYWVTASRSETNNAGILDCLSRGINCAIVFGSTRGKQHVTLPSNWNGFTVIDGDKTDLRFLDPRGRKHGKVVALELKASTTREYYNALESGFAIDIHAMDHRN